MFINSKRTIICVNRLATRNLSYANDVTKINDTSVTAKKMHTSSMRPRYAASAVLPIPQNIDAAETTRFSPLRSRDISANVILSQYHNIQASASTTPLPTPSSSIDITADNTDAEANVYGQSVDPHVQSYDCFGAISLNAVMQSNVPNPFGGMHKFTHLNMPGGQWSQEGKFTSQNLHNSHYTALRDNARSSWVSYNQDATVQKKEHATNWNTQSKRYYSTTKADLSKEKTNIEIAAEVPTTPASASVSKKEQLKKVFKEYGATVVVFHVTISLASLGLCYALVSGGIDMMPLLEYLGLASSTLSNKIATGASTFVVAYAIHKVFAPARISITLGATPFIVRFLRSKGFLKPKLAQKGK